jgi:hypothetical protein
MALNGLLVLVLAVPATMSTTPEYTSGTMLGGIISLVIAFFLLFTSIKYAKRAKVERLL